MDGGSITDNTGPGVDLDPNAVFRVSGSPVVTGNTKDGKACNVCMEIASHGARSTITVAGPLTAEAKLGVTLFSWNPIYYPAVITDAAEVSDWADEAMHWMVMHGILTGMGDGTLGPKEKATRAQIAAMFMRLCEQAG